MQCHLNSPKENHRAFAPGGQGISSDRDLVVEFDRCCRLGHDRLDAKTVHGLALELRASGEDLDLVAGPLVAVAECVGERLEVRAVEHHRLLPVEVKDRLTFLVRALPNRLQLEMRDDGDDRLALYDGSLKVAAWKC